MSSGISEVTLHADYVFDDLSASVFSDEDRDDVLDDIDELEEHLTVWGRELTKCVSILTTHGPETVYRRRDGDLRTYFVREGDVLWCIGVGKRKTTYDRDLAQIIERARSI